eukprot:403369067
MAHLENENDLLKAELKKALEELQLLREENLSLKSQIKDPSVKIKPQQTVLNHESTFITKGAENPTLQCENCSQEINRKNFDLHVVYCLKNITKCPFCKIQVDMKELQVHIDENAGRQENIESAIQTGDLEKLKNMQLHGQDLKNWVNQEDQNNSCLHYAAKANKKDIIEFLYIIGVNIDQQNKYGETALHVCSGQNKNIDLVKHLILKGANPNLKNQLGDSALDLAKRYGNHDIVLLYSAQEQSQVSSQQSMRRTKQSFFQQN